MAIPHHTCPQCGVNYTPTGPRSVTCSPACAKNRQRAQALANIRARRANQATKIHPLTCQQCRQPFTSDTTTQQYCSRACRNTHNHATGQNHRAAQAAGQAAKARAKPIKGHCDIAWTSCGTCGAEFLHNANIDRKYCCEQCRLKASYAKTDRPWRYKAKAIHKRDEYTCWLCGTKTSDTWTRGDFLSPTLDHVKPRSRGGNDDDDNLRTAHWICNSLRQDNEHVTKIDAGKVLAKYTKVETTRPVKGA